VPRFQTPIPPSPTLEQRKCPSQTLKRLSPFSILFSTARDSSHSRRHSPVFIAMPPRRSPRHRPTPLCDEQGSDPLLGTDSHPPFDPNSPSTSRCTGSYSTRTRRGAVSPTLLAFLASLSASAAAASSSDYECPDFLCPTAAQKPVQHERRAQPRHRTTVVPLGRDVPTKYIRGDDGQWRRDTGWSLHGQALSCVVSVAKNSFTAC
jgi:hypothetical protein